MIDNIYPSSGCEQQQGYGSMYHQGYMYQGQQTQPGMFVHTFQNPRPAHNIYPNCWNDQFAPQQQAPGNGPNVYPNGYYFHHHQEATQWMRPPPVPVNRPYPIPVEANGSGYVGGGYACYYYGGRREQNGGQQQGVYWKSKAVGD